VLAFLKSPQVEASPSASASAAVASAPSASVVCSSSRDTRQRMSGLRQRIAQRLVEVQHTAAILTTFNEADMSRVVELRTCYKDTFQTKHGVALGFMSFFIKASIEALKSFPVVNARIDGNEIVYQNHYDIGVAVSTERGLMVPVVRDADRLSFAAIEKAIAGFAAKARDGTITVDDLQGGTFTITNGGTFGSLLSTPILNPPQSGILGMHEIKKRPVVVDEQIAIRPMMYIALSYDHRLVDGREAVSFLVRIKDCIENPERLLFEV
jgi:2-oxoglutarate dehydrogenase E2 component (dihydrolipoamide succinyltransferase)